MIHIRFLSIFDCCHGHFIFRDNNLQPTKNINILKDLKTIVDLVKMCQNLNFYLFSSVIEKTEMKMISQILIQVIHLC